jgi:DNA repair exonuclease SbcCD ATPase subunit
VLTDRLLRDVDDEVGASIEKDIARLTAKLNQLEYTLTALRLTYSKHRQSVDKAHAKKNYLGEKDLYYRKLNFYLYHSIFNYKIAKPCDASLKFYDEYDSEETDSYQIDFKELDEAIQSHFANAEKLSTVIAADAAVYMVNESIQKSISRARNLEIFRNTIQRNQNEINEAIIKYANTLERLEKLTDEVDHNEDLFKQVQTDIKDLQAMQIRCDSLEKTHTVFRP